MLTLTGLIFIPVCVAAMTAGLRAQLATFGAGAVLSSAAVVNLASFGIQPAYFMGLLLLGVAGVLALMRGGYCLDRAVLVRMAPLAVLLLACLNALFWATAVFWDDVWVVSGRQMFDLSSAERYSFRSENLNQLAYLILNILLTLLLADRLVRLPVQALLKTAHTAVLGAFFVATLFVAWDWLAHSTGIYFPDAFLHTNAFYAAAHEQSFGDIARISGPFSEPSALAYAYGGFLAYASGRYLADRTARSLLMVLVAAGALVVSTSTTAYALLALWVAGMLLALPLSRLIAGGVPNGGAAAWRWREWRCWRWSGRSASCARIRTTSSSFMKAASPARPRRVPSRIGPRQTAWATRPSRPPGAWVSAWAAIVRARCRRRCSPTWGWPARWRSSRSSACACAGSGAR